MADCEPSPSHAPMRRPSTTKPQAELELFLNNLRGVPDDTPALPEALTLRDADWRLVVAYCRISHDRHKRDGHGVADQAQHCARIAAQHRLIVVHRYVDNDKSASKAGVERPEFEAMLQALQKGATPAGYPIDGVVCVCDDRLYRDVHTYIRFRACFTAHPSRVYADGLGSYDLYTDDAAQRGLVGASVARAESAKQQHRARLNHRVRAERGEPVAGRRPFGWNADKETLHPGESEVVRNGVQSLLQGKTLTAITQDFVDSGYKSTLGNPWQRQTVKQILRNPRICGYRMLNGTLVRDAHGQPVIGRWDPIVSPEEWLGVREVLEKQRHHGGWNKGGVQSQNDRTYLLTGLVRCGRPLPEGRPCGASMHGHPTGTSFVYRCRCSKDGGCGKVSRQGPAVDGLITEYAVSKLESQHHWTPRIELPWPGRRELEIARQRKANLQDEWYAGEISDSDYFSRLPCQETKIKRLVTEQAAWLASRHSATHTGLGMRAYWDGLSVEVKRVTLFELLEAVIILPGTKGSHRFDPTAVVPVWRMAGTEDLAS